MQRNPEKVSSELFLHLTLSGWKGKLEIWKNLESAKQEEVLK